MKPGDVIYGSQLAGDFTLPKDPDEKLAFIAGGIGVTPFRSMVQDLINRRDKRSVVVLLYGNEQGRRDRLCATCSIGPNGNWACAPSTRSPKTSARLEHPPGLHR